ncbi:helix-turn-helix transcriptional regulator [Enterocloster asparagiformis]|uniref:helix-turn-helix domain-containing protein n=1 Tax=Enterocloster asparagiformis TaxID=333367 RepID=UPI002A83BF88|nr:helix-turn-helix transcriptional regulator [Enterocloster asparagiformis]
MSINERFFKTLEEKGIKASEIAKVLNVNNSIISAWKTRGTNPPIEYTVQICKLLGISIEY